MQNKLDWAGLAVAMALASGSSVGATQARTLNLAAHERADVPGGATLTLDEVNDSRCRAAERCAPSQAAARDAVATVTLQMSDGQHYQGTIAVGGMRGQASAAHAAHAKLGNWLVELVGITPEGRELPADGPGGRVQRAELRITPSDRVAVAVGSTVDLPNAGVSLRVLSIDDHRCPRDMACASAGHVQIEAEVSGPKSPARRLTFGSPKAPKQVHAWQGFDIELCDVLPRRSSLAKGAQAPALQAEFFVSPAIPEGATLGGSAARLTCSPPIP